MSKQPTQGELLREYLRQHLEREELKKLKKRESIQQKTKKHKDEKLASVQVFLEKDLVERFKAKAKEMGVSQASVIRGAVIKFLSGND